LLLIRIPEGRTMTEELASFIFPIKTAVTDCKVRITETEQRRSDVSISRYFVSDGVLIR
jgi:hypothetical protein